MESLVHRISLECRWTNPFQDKRKVANHEDEKPCVSLTDLEVDLRRPIEIQGKALLPNLWMVQLPVPFSFGSGLILTSSCGDNFFFFARVTFTTLLRL